MRQTNRNNRKQKGNKFTISMQKKLVVLFLCVLLAFAGLSVRIMLISRDNEQSYQKQVLSSWNMTVRRFPTAEAVSWMLTV